MTQKLCQIPRPQKLSNSFKLFHLGSGLKGGAIPRSAKRPDLPTPLPGKTNKNQWVSLLAWTPPKQKTCLGGSCWFPQNGYPQNDIPDWRNQSNPKSIRLHPRPGFALASGRRHAPQNSRWSERLLSVCRKKWRVTWVWVKIKTPGYGPQVIVFAAICRSILGTYF